MATATTSIGPADHGRPIGEEEFYDATPEPGWRYELIDGRVSVSPEAAGEHDDLATWLLFLLHDYSLRRPDVFNHVSPRAVLHVPDRPGVTRPQPDIVAFADYPLHLPRRERRHRVDWREMTPYLVVEITSPGTEEKDTVRNVELYEQVPSIREYWIFDSETDDDVPGFRVYRRRGGGWQRPIDVPAGGGYTSRWLPGFTLAAT